MSWKIDTENKAILAAQKYYDDVLVKAGMFPGELRRLPPSRDDAIMQLANEKLPAIQEKFPEKDYDESAAKLLNSFDEDKTMRWLYDYGDDPATAKRKDDFAAMKSMVDPDPSKGEKSWMDMDRKELEHRMGQFGFDSRKKGDYNKFLEALASNQTSYDKAKAVEEFKTENPATSTIASIVTPTAYQVAMKQALTDEPYDERKIKAAAALDVATEGAMAGVGANMPYWASVFGMPAVELGRQGIARNEYGLEIDPSAVGGASVAAGTVPAMLKGLSYTISRNASNEAVRGVWHNFMKGVRGSNEMTEKEIAKSAADREKNAIVESLIRMRNEGKPTFANPSMKTPAEKARIKEWEDMRNKLSLLGYGEQSYVPWGSEGLTTDNVYDALMSTMKNRVANRPGYREFTIPQMMGEQKATIGKQVWSDDNAVRESLERAFGSEKTFTPYTPTSAEEFGTVIKSIAAAGKSDKPATKAAKKAGGTSLSEAEKEKLAKVYGILKVSEEGAGRPYATPQAAPDYSGYDNAIETAGKRAADFRANFPNTIRYFETPAGNVYRETPGELAAMRTGRALGTLLSSQEAATRVNPYNAVSTALSGKMPSSVDDYKESEWYKKLLVVNPSMAEAIDLAMKKKRKESK